MKSKGLNIIVFMSSGIVETAGRKWYGYAASAAFYFK